MLEGVLLQQQQQQQQQQQHQTTTTTTTTTKQQQNQRRLVQPKCRTETYTYGIKSVRYQGARLWNDHGQNFKHAMTVKDLRNRLYSGKALNAAALFVTCLC